MSWRQQLCMKKTFSLSDIVDARPGYIRFQLNVFRSREKPTIHYKYTCVIKINPPEQFCWVILLMLAWGWKKGESSWVGEAFNVSLGAVVERKTIISSLHQQNLLIGEGPALMSLEGSLKQLDEDLKMPNCTINPTSYDAIMCCFIIFTPTTAQPSEINSNEANENI